MTDTKISGLSSATKPLAGSEIAPLVQSGGNVSARVDTISAQRFPKSGSGLVTWPLGQIASTVTQALTVGSYYGLPFRARPGATFDRVLMEVNAVAPAADGKLRFGVYAHDYDARLPAAGAPLYDSGDVAFLAANMAIGTTPKSISITAFTVPDDGVFWLVMQTDTTFTLRRGSGANAIGTLCEFVAQSPSANNLLNAPVPNLGGSKTGSFGAMPTNIGLTASALLPLIAASKS